MVTPLQHSGNFCIVLLVDITEGGLTTTLRFAGCRQAVKHRMRSGQEPISRFRPVLAGVLTISKLPQQLETYQGADGMSSE